MGLKGKTIVVTGPTGMVGPALSKALAVDNRVIALARFSDTAVRADLEASEVECLAVDLVAPDFSAVPREVDVVLNLAVIKSGDWPTDLAVCAEATGHLMSHFRDAEAFLHCSSGAVYQPNGGEPFTEDSPHGNHHEHMMPTYSISKIAGESVARFGAQEFDLPTVIARLNVPYGDGGGWPYFHLLMMRAGMAIEVNPDGARYNLIHDEDIAADLPALLGQASVPAATLNWASPELVSIAQWCEFMAEVDGCDPPQIVKADAAIPSTVMDTTHIRELRPERLVGWQDGLRRMVQNNPA
ncbi:NAD-dependent epimerase/dehydratase family protein [Candidatus Poriferisocius sp.]|uniref:NAD-dependent epimerase/dehydratase family protein n=1 Tax=Candidatus Poriferisocius sp. TaxID=3101276 RepID=UPI003B5951ED